MVIQAWSRMLRLPNLGIIIFIQALIFNRFISPYFLFEELSLTKSECILFVITLLCVAASGYVINNICDHEIDSFDIKKSIIPNFFSIKQSWQLYIGLVLIGLAIAIYLSYTSGFYYSFFIYPLAVLSLAYYSLKLKCLPLIGNLLISTLTAFVIAIIPYVFWEDLNEIRISDYNTWAALMYRLVLLTTLAFLCNLTREIIKDIEDLESDRLLNCHSTASYFGTKKSKFIALNIWFALLIICGSAIWFANGISAKLWGAFSLGLPALYIFHQMIISKETKDFSKLSLFLKLFMILGIFYWCKTI